MRALVAAVLFLVGGPLLASGPSAAARTDPPPVEIADADAAVVLSGEPAPVRLLNTTGRPLSVGVAASARAADGGAAAIEVRRDGAVVTTVDLGPGGDVWLALDLVGTPPPTAITGYFVATAGEVAVRRPVTAGPAAKAAITPAVTSWTTEWAPLWPWSDPAPLPGRVPVTSCPATAEPVSATVVSGHDTATVTARCAGGALLLDLTGVPAGPPSRGTGVYQGELDFGGTALAVSVARSSSVLAALGWLLAGIAAALACASYAADRRPFAARKTAIAAIEAPPGSLAEPVAGAKARLRAALLATRPGPVRGLLPWPDGDSADRLAAIDGDTARLRTTAGLTAEHDRGLRVLRERSAALAARFPGMADRFEELRNPSSDLSAAALANLVADTAALPGLAALVDRLEVMRAAVSDARPGARDRLAARARLHQLFGALSRLERPVRAADLLADVEETAALVDRLTPVGDLPREGGFSARGVAPEAAGDLVRTVVVGLGAVLDGTGRTAMVVRDAAAACVVAVLALWTGFAALYVAADTWGTLWDVLAAVTWGAAATAVSGPLLAAVRRIGSSGQPGD